MRARRPRLQRNLERQLAEAQATIEALLSGQVDAVVGRGSSTPLLLSRAQESLRESEERYRRIVETANEGIWTLDNEARVTFVNRRLAELLGYPEHEILGRSVSEFLAGAAAAMAPLAAGAGEPLVAGRAAADDEPREIEIPVMRRDGSVIWALIRTSPIRDTEGNLAGTLLMMTDKTTHKQAEDALRKSEAQYRQIVEATSDGLMKIDGEGRIAFVNRRLGEMLGYGAHELLGRDPEELLVHVHARRGAGAFRASASPATDASLRHEDGSEIAVSIAVTGMFDGAGHHLGDLAVVRDDPEKRKLQSHLMVVDRMASVGTLAAGVAHEINNPLAAVLSNLSFLTDSLPPAVAGAGVAGTPGPIPEEIKAALDDARGAAERVQQIVREMKMFSPPTCHESFGPVDVKAVMASSVRMVANELRRRARLVDDCRPVPAVEASEAGLGQVFLHLLVNAAYALPAGAPDDNEIRVSTCTDGQWVVIDVSDTGPGIAPEIIPRIFDAFFTTKPVGTGTGLGLAVCQRLVTDMGGRLTVDSEPGKGARFRVALPVAVRERITLRMAPGGVATAPGLG